MEDADDVKSGAGGHILEAFTSFNVGSNKTEMRNGVGSDRSDLQAGAPCPVRLGGHALFGFIEFYPC
jgi:hypothetical protein